MRRRFRSAPVQTSPMASTFTFERGLQYHYITERCLRALARRTAQEDRLCGSECGASSASTDGGSTAAAAPTG